MVHRKQTRLRHFDYGNSGSYYITVCTFQRKRFLSVIDHDVVHLTSYGRIVEEELQKTVAMRQHLTLGEYVIMPNHVHLVLHVTERTAERLDERADGPMRKFGGSQKHSMSSIIANFKAAVTTRLRRMTGKDDAEIWQRGFYEHIIRDEPDLQRITEYIRSNALNWHLDQENPERTL